MYDLPWIAKQALAGLQNPEPYEIIAGIYLHQVDLLMDAILDTSDQLFINKATWSLVRWENEYRLPILENGDVITRRQRILTKKRGARAKLDDILKAIESTLELYWGPTRICLTFTSLDDVYNYGPLVVAMEKYKPSHLGYCLRLEPPMAGNGYTLHACHQSRGLRSLRPLSGSLYAGRWPRWNEPGVVKVLPLIIDNVMRSGSGLFNPTGWYIGDTEAKSNRGTVIPGRIEVISKGLGGFCEFKKGPISCGITPGVSSSASTQINPIRLDNRGGTGTYQYIPCGTWYCGKEAA